MEIMDRPDFSLLPWRILYFLSDAVYGLIYYIIGYRKDVVMKNLLIAFPEKTEKERILIAKNFTTISLILLLKPLNYYQ